MEDSEEAMKRTAAMVLVISLLILSFVVSISSLLDHPAQKTVTVGPKDRFLDSQEPSDPIVISSNSDFALMDAPGVGTPSDPYRIENLRISYSDVCILIHDTTAHFVIRNCILESTADSPAIQFSNVENGKIEQCEFTQGASGVTLYDSTDCSVEDNTFYGCWNGITLFFSRNNTVIGNKIHNNHRGVLVEQSAYCEIVNNSIYSNWEYGIEITFYSHNNTFYGNSIGWNDVSGGPQGNALDSGEDNYFDDGVSIGNLWSDFNGTVPYIIPGTGGPADYSTDNFPQLLEDDLNPVVVPLHDIAIDVDSIGNSITWLAYDVFAESYVIMENELIAEVEVWDGGEITYGLDDLDEGVYSMALIVYDGAGNYARDDIYVSVVKFILGGIGTELVMIASGITVVCFVIMVIIVKKLS